MFPPLFVLPIQFVALIDQARRDARKTDTDLTFETGFKRESDWSKAKHNVRPLNLHRLGRASIAFQRAFCKQWLAALEVEEPSTAVSELDLLQAILDGIKELKPRRRRRARSEAA